VLTREGWTWETLSVGDEVAVSAPGGVPRREQRQIDQSARSEDFSVIWRIEGGGVPAG